MGALLSIHGLTKTFGGFTAISGVSFEVGQGEILGLIGPNGSGKSTTFNLVAGALAPSSGSIRFDGREIAGTHASKVAHLGIGRTYQIPRPFRKLSLMENVALAAYYGQAEQPAREKAWVQAREALELVNLPTDDGVTFNTSIATAEIIREVQFNFPFSNQGQVRVDQGAVYFANGGVQESGFNIASGARLGFNGGAGTNNAGTTFSGAGEVYVSAGTVAFNTGFNHTRFNQVGGDVFFNAAVSFASISG